MLRSLFIFFTLLIAAFAYPQGKTEVSKCHQSSMDLLSILEENDVYAILAVTKGRNFRNQEEFVAQLREKFPKTHAKLEYKQEMEKIAVAKLSQESQDFLNKYLPIFNSMSIDMLIRIPSEEELQGFEEEYLEAVNNLSQAAKNELIQNCFSVIPGY